ncbi:ABC transporter substrate-binding protein [Mahella australiensis]|uniref:Extracellular solute-binding protein family 1 n=1 Tax=Mahella australiensis (strain DSM 15567 / CIP 107919 / 50-1 BON) TaxID=697281 RepID=F4A325_MAHA5|nr:ABC transporter substrate-binding protein [Mahella australiensis]AEE95240.1 extracellular solute-binding protein family 1 [Mahella australiensis 50-1 BON]
MKKFIIVLLVGLMIMSLAACGGTSSTDKSNKPAETNKTGDNAEQPTSGEKVKVIVWGLNPLAVGSGNKEMIDAFNKSHPNIEMVPQSTPGTGGYATQDVTKLLAAIAGGTPPDITWLDRFTAAQFAARNALSPLDEYIEAGGLDMGQYASYAVDEIKFDGKIWALPWDTDTRPFYWNKDVFQKAGLDPETPPNTWDELLDYSKKLTVTDAKGNFKQIGFIPNFGNSWLYLYGFQNGAKFLSDDGRTALLNAPEVVEALEFMVKGYDLLGGAKKVNAYSSTFQGEANDPFLTGQVAMIINVNNALQGWSRYKPDLNFGAALAPTPTGENKITWSGGWSWAMPKGAKHPKEAFEVMKWLTTEGIKVQQQGAADYNKKQGRDIFIPFPAAYTPANEELIKTYIDPLSNETFKKAAQVGMDAMSVSRARPVSPVGEVLWTEHARAIDKAIYHEMTPKEALDAGNKAVQAELDKFWAEYDASHK